MNLLAARTANVHQVLACTWPESPRPILAAANVPPGASSLCTVCLQGFQRLRPAVHGPDEQPARRHQIHFAGASQSPSTAAIPVQASLQAPLGAVCKCTSAVLISCYGRRFAMCWVQDSHFKQDIIIRELQNQRLCRSHPHIIQLLVRPQKTQSLCQWVTLLGKCQATLLSSHHCSGCDPATTAACSRAAGAVTELHVGLALFQLGLLCLWAKCTSCRSSVCQSM